MFSLTHSTKVYCAKDPLDMRKQIDDMALIVQEKLELDPFSQHLFLFRNKTKDKIKALWWHNNGFIAIYKRLEKGCFNWPQCEVGTASLIQRQSSWLFEGQTIKV